MTSLCVFCASVLGLEVTWRVCVEWADEWMDREDDGLCLGKFTECLYHIFVCASEFYCLQVEKRDTGMNLRRSIRRSKSPGSTDIFPPSGSEAILCQKSCVSSTISHDERSKGAEGSIRFSVLIGKQKGISTVMFYTRIDEAEIDTSMRLTFRRTRATSH